MLQSHKAPENAGGRQMTGGEAAASAVLLLLSLLLNGVICLYFSEIVSRAGKSSVLSWMSANPRLCGVNLLFIFTLSFFFVLLTKRGWAGVFLSNFLFLGIAAVNMYKQMLRGEPLLLTDIGELKEAAEILPNYRLAVPVYFAIALAILLVICPLLFAGWRVRLPAAPLNAMRAGAFLAASLTIVYYLNIPLVVPYQYKLLYQSAGLVRGLWETRAKKSLEEPENYSEDAVLAILQGSGGEALPADMVKPDIVFIMSESLFDLYRLGGLEMTADPLADLKALQEAYAGGDFLSPHLGGGTYYSEYEVLTGYSSEDTPGAIFNDKSATKDGMETVPSLLRDAGYATVAVHPHAGSFYNRTYNYGKFGFEKLLFSNSGLPVIREKVGPYPSDSVLFSCLEQEYENRDRTKPWFCHCVTYQNHGSYNYDYDRRDILVTNRDGDEKKASENYVNALLTHVEALESLLDYFSKQDRPVVVVVWGDHAPNVREFGLEWGSDKSSTKYYRTPFLIWNNYGADLRIGEECVSAYRLGACVLNRLGFREDPYFNWLSKAQPDLLTALHLVERNGKFSSDDEEYAAMSGDLLLLHYDRLKGASYWRKAK